MITFRRATLLLIALCLLSSAAYLRMRPRPRPDVASPEEAVVPPALPTQTPAARDARPTRVQVVPLLERAFGGLVTPDEQAAPWFAAGDFDADTATDLAVAVRPRDAAAAAALAEPTPAFRLQDADAAGPPAPAALAAGERLLAIVHGVPGAAWSDVAAERPGFLVRHASGRDLRARPLAGLSAELRMRVTRAHAGDVLAVRRDGTSGFVFWNGAAYVWAGLPDDGARAVRDGAR
ncbi:MAG: hypothetical protein ABW221_08955 [Vicinamibacteria bacterium]